jgi:hypothetical protein
VRPLTDRLDRTKQNRLTEEARTSHAVRAALTLTSSPLSSLSPSSGPESACGEVGLAGASSRTRPRRCKLSGAVITPSFAGNFANSPGGVSWQTNARYVFSMLCVRNCRESSRAKGFVRARIRAPVVPCEHLSDTVEFRVLAMAHHARKDRGCLRLGLSRSTHLV